MTNLKLINMSDTQPEQVAWLANPYLPFGKITIVQGDPGCGKTSMMLAIAADLTRGRATLGETTCEPSNVIFQTAEDGLADTIKPRLEHDKAKRIILTLLSHGEAVAANDIIEEARDDGVSLVTLKRAKAELAIDTFKKGSQWFWRIPVEANFAEIEECQGNRITA